MILKKRGQPTGLIVLKMSDREIYKAYHNLWIIEESFRIMKSELDARPVYLQKEETITAYRLAEKIMSYSNGAVPYETAISSARNFYRHKPLFWGWSHVGNDYIASEMAKRYPKVQA
ncbi:MAG: hypothetical protein IJ608_03120 [Lachnospiraceae bacterium]|nr:hypothetical protein [Lachnospiraceae bacterium]